MSTSLTTKAASSVQRFDTLHLRQRRMVRLRRRPSSSGFRAWGWGRVCGSLGGAGGGWSRCLSWSTDPSRPGHRCRNGRHRPTAQTLSKKTEGSKKFKLLRSSRTGKKMVCRISWMLPFLSPKSDLSSLTTPSAETVVLEVDRWFVILSRQKTTQLKTHSETMMKGLIDPHPIYYDDLRPGLWSDDLWFYRELVWDQVWLQMWPTWVVRWLDQTNCGELTHLLHFGDIVHVVSLPQVEGELWDRRERQNVRTSRGNWKQDDEFRLTPPFPLVFLKTLWQKNKTKTTTKKIS